MLSGISKYPIYRYPMLYDHISRILTGFFGWEDTINLKVLLERSRTINEATEYVVLHRVACDPGMDAAIMSYLRYHKAKQNGI